MTDIKIRLIADGLTELPGEAKDSTIIASRLENADLSAISSAPNWREIERVRPGNDEYMELRVSDATLNDYDQAALDTFAQSICSNISGIKEHPDGWVEEEPDPRQSE